MNQCDPWPDEDVTKMREMRADGKSLAQIANAIGRTRNAVAGMVHRLGISLPASRVRDLQVTPRTCLPKREPRPPKPPKVKAVKIAPPPPPPQPVVSLVHARPFMDRASRECAWMLDDGRSCCAAVTRGSYCAGHAAQVYRPTKGLAVEKMARKFG
jgi:hypothetical protein